MDWTLLRTTAYIVAFFGLAVFLVYAVGGIWTRNYRMSGWGVVGVLLISMALASESLWPYAGGLLLIIFGTRIVFNSEDIPKKMIGVVSLSLGLTFVAIALTHITK